jgi:hypothetical protein
MGISGQIGATGAAGVCIARNPLDNVLTVFKALRDHLE